MSGHATWPDVAMAIVLMIFFFAAVLLAGLSQAAENERKSQQEHDLTSQDGE